MIEPIPYMSITVYNWHFYPRMIDWKIANRDLIKNNYELQNTINLSILVDLTTFFEGFLTKILNNAIEKRQNNEDIFSKKIVNHYRDKINELTWSKYSEYVELILGKKLSEIIECEVFKTINVLFNFRNLIVHANDLRLHYYHNGIKDDYYSDVKFNKIIKYFKEKKLIDWSFSSFSEDKNFNYLINDSIIDFFYHHTINFIKNLVDILPENEKNDFAFHFPEYFKNEKI